MQMTEIAEALAWGDETSSLSALRAGFVELLGERLGGALGRTEAREPGRGSVLLLLLRGLPDPAFTRFLTAPETSYRLLWPERHAGAAVEDFMLRALQAESVLAGVEGVVVEGEAWTALGDFGVRPGGSSYASPALPGLMPLDFRSPHARDLSRGGPSAADFGEESRYGEADAAALAARAAKASRGIADVNPRVGAFVDSFTSVSMFVRAALAGEYRFVSRSPERHIGLTVFVNAHVCSADGVELAEALVHEAIHSALDMHEALERSGADARRWISDAGLYDGASRTVSPWTGSRLALPTYLHACFVWYGLVQFWSQALGTSAFPEGRTVARLREAVRGFLDDEMLRQLEPYRPVIRTDLWTALARMRERLVETMTLA